MSRIPESGGPEYAAEVDRSRYVVLAVAILLACSRNGPPSSLFEAAGYHVRDGKVYYLNAFPGNGADAATFQALDSTYGRDSSNIRGMTAPTRYAG